VSQQLDDVRQRFDLALLFITHTCGSRSRPAPHRRNAAGPRRGAGPHRGGVRGAPARVHPRPARGRAGPHRRLRGCLLRRC